jgi:hypothetical protein
MLTHAAYDEIGGVKQALAVHAEEAFRKLDPQEEQRVRRIFLPNWYNRVRPRTHGGSPPRVSLVGRIGSWWHAWLMSAWL